MKQKSIYTTKCVILYNQLCIIVQRLCCWIEHQIKVVESTVRLGDAECVGGALQAIWIGTTITVHQVAVSGAMRPAEERWR